MRKTDGKERRDNLKENENDEILFALESLLEMWCVCACDVCVCVYVYVCKCVCTFIAPENWCTLDELICHLRENKEMVTPRWGSCVPLDCAHSSAFPGAEKEHISPRLKSRRSITAQSLLYFTLRALHREEAQLMPVELNLLNCTERERGLKGVGDFESRLQEGQFQVEAENLNLWIFPLGTEESIFIS